MSAEIHRTPEMKRKLINEYSTSLLQGNPPKAAQLIEDADVDLSVYASTVLILKPEIETEGTWDKLKTSAQKELNQIPPDFMSQLLDRYKPFLEVQPASHSKGHFARDLVHLTEIINHMPPGSIDDVELLVGIIAGAFHDGGTGVVKRHEEPNHLARHAEVGAHMLGVLGSNIIPPALLKMSQYAIAAHTNYQQKQHQVRPYINGKLSATIPPYQTADKQAALLAQASDRGDIISSIVVPRHILGYMKDGYLFVDGKFQQINSSDSQTFDMLFSRDPSVNFSFLEVIARMGNSTEPGTSYSKLDPPWLWENYIRPNGIEVQRFCNIVRNSAEDDADTLLSDNSLQFARLCRMLEPGIDIDEKLEVFLNQFPKIDVVNRRAWDNGFQALVSQLYPALHARMKSAVNKTPQDLKGRNRILQDIILQMKNEANCVLDAIDPKYLDMHTYADEDIPNILQVL